MTTIMMMLMMLVIKKDIEGVGLSLLSDGVRELSFQSRQTFARMLMMMVTAIVMVTHKQTNIQGVSKKVANRILRAMVHFPLVHNCTIFLCSLDVRNIVQCGDPLYTGFFSTQGSGGYT